MEITLTPVNLAKTLPGWANKEPKAAWRDFSSLSASTTQPSPLGKDSWLAMGLG